MAKWEVPPDSGIFQKNYMVVVTDCNEDQLDKTGALECRNMKPNSTSRSYERPATGPTSKA
jgi:hypothetical protein